MTELRYSEEQADEQLCSGVVAGQADCFNALYQRYCDGIFKFCLLQVGDSDARDVLQETFVTVWTGAKTFRGESSFRSWLYAIAKRKCIDLHRKRGHTIVAPDEYFLSIQATTAGGGDGAVERIGLRAALTELSLEMKEAVFLVYYKGLAYEEAAGVLGVPPGTVRSRVHNAKQRLSQALGGSVESATPATRGAHRRHEGVSMQP